MVQGTLTSFVAAEGDQFILRGLTAVIAQRVSSSQILLKQAWNGPTISGASDWDISLTGPYWQSSVATNKRLSDLLSKFEAGPIKWDAAGLPAERANYNNQGAGFTFLAVGDPWVIYTKLANTGSASDWSPGQVIKGSEATSTAEAKAAASAAQGSASTASSAADVAAGAASAAAGQASSASGSASSAAGAASSAAGSASNAAGSASAAQGAADTATSQASTATTAAGTATSQAGIAAAAASTATAQATQAAASLSAGRLVYDTLAQLTANLAPIDTAMAEVIGDGLNNGLYVKVGAPGSGSWSRKSSATVPALDALTAFVRGIFSANEDGSFNLTDAGGNIGLRFDGANGLQAVLAQFTRIVATAATASKFEAPGSFSLTASDDGALLVTDLEGNAGLRLDSTALTIANLVVKGALSLGGQMAAASYSFGGCTLSAYPDPNVAFVISDTAGWVLLALLADGTLLVPKIQTAALGTGSDYSADYIAERSNRAVSLANGFRGLLDTTSAAAIYAYNHVLWYGQSLCAAQEGWPAKTLSGRSDVLMIGQSTRPGGVNTATSPSPLGDSVLRPAVARVQNVSTGALIDAAGQAALAAGDGSLGEDSGVGAMLFARRLFLQRLGVQAADDRRFVTSNVGVSGRSIEELSKGAATEYFNRLRAMATAVKNAATAAGGSYGVPALFWMQGEWNYFGSNGGSTDKATYKANLKKLYSDFIADICVGIAGQAEKPAIITYQTGGSYTVDATDMSIGMAQWELSQENPSWYLAAPAYPVTDKGGHLDANGYRWLGLQMGKVFHETVVMRRRWKPLSPIQATVRGRTVLVDFHLPSGTPLQFQPVYVGQVATTYADKGFTVIDDNGVLPLSGVTIAGDAIVQISLGRAPVGTVNVYYARRTPFVGGGNLCDSDPTVAPFNYEYSAGSGDYAAANIAALVGLPYPLWNWCIAFKMTAVAN